MNLETIFDDFGTVLKEDIQKSLIKHRVEYDGQESRLGASIVFQFKKDGKKFNLSMNDYWEVVNSGRGAGKKGPPLDPLIKWIKRKDINLGVSLNSKKRLRLAKVGKTKAEVKVLKKESKEVRIKSIAFAMSKSIGKKGIKGNHFVDEVIGDGRLPALANAISASIKEEITITFNKAA